VRVNFNYFISENVFQFILDAVEMVAEHGWRLLDDYVFEPNSGQWRHHGGRPKPPQSLHDITYRLGRMEYRQRHINEPEWVLSTYLEDAKRILLQATQGHGVTPPTSPDFEALRWFPLPGEKLFTDRQAPDVVVRPLQILHQPEAR
jgi:hypothetical protein